MKTQLDPPENWQDFEALCPDPVDSSQAPKHLALARI